MTAPGIFGGGPGVCRSALPWIDQLKVHRLEIRSVSGDDLQAMDQRSRGDQYVALRPRIGHVQTRATLRDCDIHRKNSALERWQHFVVDPGAKHSSLCVVAALDHQCPGFDLKDRDDRQIKIKGRNRVSPGSDFRIDSMATAQLRQHIGVEQIHQVKVAGRKILPPKWGGSNAMSSAPGWPSISRMVGPPAVSRR